MNKVDHERSISEASLAEVRQLREENVRLRSLLTANGIPIPEAPISVNETPQVASVVPGVRKPEVGKAEQRIALFRSLFFGRDDVYAIRWENADGRSGYMPKADRDWKSYLGAKEEDRKKVDRLTRKYRPLTDDVRELKHTVQRGLCCPCGRPGIVAFGLCPTCYSLKRQDQEYFGGLREQVLERDEYRCRVCEAPGRDKRSITVHHRVPGKSVLNLMISLCPGCHAKVHRIKAVLSQMPPLLLELWREQHPEGHEQTVLEFKRVGAAD